jgi:hypothetical protein
MAAAAYTTIPYPYPGTDETPMFTKDIWIASGSPENVILAEGWLVIQSEQMANVVSLKSIIIPASLYGIGTRVFFNASGLEKITFNRNSQMTHITARVFENATALNSINIPAEVREIEAYAFLNTPRLREITFDQNSQIASIHATAFSRSGLSLVVIGESALNRLNVERRALNMQPLRFGENNIFYGKANVKVVSRKQQTDMLHLATEAAGYPPRPATGFIGSIAQAIGLRKPPPQKTRPPLPKHLANYTSSFLMEEDVVPKSPAALAARAAANATAGGRKSRRRKRGIRRKSRKVPRTRKTKKRRRTMKRK